MEWKYDELETPITDTEYIDVVTRGFNEILSLNDKSWITIYDQDSIIMEECVTENDKNIKFLKTTIYIKDVDADDFSRITYNADYQHIKKVYDGTLDHKIVKIITTDDTMDDIKICHTKFRTPIGTSNRDMVVVKSRKLLEDGRYVHISKSINYEEIPFNKNFVRFCYTSGLIITQSDKNIKITSIDFIDPKGWVPKFIIDIITTTVSKRLTKLGELYKSIVNEKN